MLFADYQMIYEMGMFSFVVDLSVSKLRNLHEFCVKVVLRIGHANEVIYVGRTSMFFRNQRMKEIGTVRLGLSDGVRCKLHVSYDK